MRSVDTFGLNDRELSGGRGNEFLDHELSGSLDIYDTTPHDGDFRITFHLVGPIDEHAICTTGLRYLDHIHKGADYEGYVNYELSLSSIDLILFQQINFFNTIKNKGSTMSVNSPILNNSLLQVKSFTELLAVRSLTGIMRINEHHMINNHSTYLKEETFTIKPVDEPNFISVIDQLKEAGYVCEVRTNTDKNRTVNAYFTCEDILVVAIVLIFEDNKLRYYGYATMEDRALLKDSLDIIEPFVKEKPTVVNYVTGFSDTGPIVDHREIDLKYNVPLDCFYPYIEEGIQELSENFIKSNSNLLLLVGERGTGKTSLLREFCRQFKGKNIYQMCGDKVILHAAFDSYLASLPEQSLVIIEDADGILGKRVEANTSLSMLLNELDGISNKGTKFVITTNLENLKSVDDAVLRVGRCYKTINFRPLNSTEANVIADKLELNTTFSQSISLAEIFNGMNQKVKTTLGFGS